MIQFEYICFVLLLWFTNFGTWDFFSGWHFIFDSFFLYVFKKNRNASKEDFHKCTVPFYSAFMLTFLFHIDKILPVLNTQCRICNGKKSNKWNVPMEHFKWSEKNQNERERWVANIVQKKVQISAIVTWEGGTFKRYDCDTDDWIESNWIEWNEAGRVNNKRTKNESIFFLLNNNNSNSSRMFFIHWIRNCAKF